jgi:hypothetical protein
MKSFSAQVRDFARRTEENMREVYRQSVQDVIEAAQTDQLSYARGAESVEPGKIPVDIGFLRNSLASGLNGSFGAPDANSYVLAIQGMDIGDTGNFAWTAEYALSIETGWGPYPGAHFVGVNAAKWPEFVKVNAVKYAV